MSALSLLLAWQPVVLGISLFDALTGGANVGVASHLPRCDNSCLYIPGTMSEALGGGLTAQGSQWQSLDSNPGPSTLHHCCIVNATKVLAKKKSRLIIKAHDTNEYLVSYLCSKSLLSTYANTLGAFLEYSSKQN